jgi:hypothetical protein
LDDSSGTVEKIENRNNHVQFGTRFRTTEWSENMKKNILMVMSLAMLIIAGTVSASAQITDRLVANIPFEFSVRDKTLPAGKYYIKSLDTYDEGVFEMQNAQGKQVAVFLSENATARTMPEKTKLIFDRVGDHYFLSEIFESGNTQGIALEKSPAEKRLEKTGMVSEKQIFNLNEQNLVRAEN